MLNFDRDYRCNASQALEHAWFQEQCHLNDDDDDQYDLSTNQLKQFYGRIKLEIAALNFIHDNLITEEEKMQMKRIFTDFDTNYSGKLNKYEVIDGLMSLGMTEDRAKFHTTRIFNEVKKDENCDSLSLDNWYIATMNKKNVVNKNRLQHIYRVLDTDRDG